MNKISYYQFSAELLTAATLSATNADTARPYDPALLNEEQYEKVVCIAVPNASQIYIIQDIYISDNIVRIKAFTKNLINSLDALTYADIIAFEKSAINTPQRFIPLGEVFDLDPPSLKLFLDNIETEVYSFSQSKIFVDGSIIITAQIENEKDREDLLKKARKYLNQGQDVIMPIRVESVK